MTDDNKEVEMLDYRVYNNIIIIGFIFLVMQRLIVICHWSLSWGCGGLFSVNRFLQVMEGRDLAKQ